LSTSPWLSVRHPGVYRSIAADLPGGATESWRSTGRGHPPRHGDSATPAWWKVSVGIETLKFMVAESQLSTQDGSAPPFSWRRNGSKLKFLSCHDEHCAGFAAAGHPSVLVVIVGVYLAGLTRCPVGGIIAASMLERAGDGTLQPNCRPVDAGFSQCQKRLGSH